MKTIKSTYIFILLLLLSANDSVAQPKRSLILLGNLHQAVNFSYDYNGQVSDSDKSEAFSRDHLFSEAYRFDIDYGIYDTRLLKGHIAAELKLNEELFSTTGRPSGSALGHDILYNLNGTFLGRHSYPLNFYANSGISKVQRTFVGSFDLATDSYGAGFFLKNKFLPLQFNYSRNKSTTSGLDNNRDQVLENYLLSAKHKIKDFSYTEAILSYSSYSTDTRGSIPFSESFLTNDFALSNQLAWESRGKERVLSTSYRYRQEGGDRDSSNSDFSEILTWDFGKALKSGARYANNNQKAGIQTKRENSWDAWVRHSLFQNLQTYAQFRGRSVDFSFGTEEEVSGAVSVDYQKKLPAGSQLHLGFTQTYGITDRKVPDDIIISVKNERIVVTFLALFTPIPLKNPDVISGSVIIRNANPAIRVTPYVEGPLGDYTLSQEGIFTFININLGGEIAEDDILLVDYQIITNPSVKYTSNVRTVQGSLQLYENRYRIYAGWDEYAQNPLSGRSVATDSLVESRAYRAGLEFNGKTSSFRAEYSNNDSSYSKNQTLDGSFRYTKNFTVSSLNLHMRDRLTIRGNPSSTPESIFASGSRSSDKSVTDNSFSAGGQYQRSLKNNATLKLSAKYLNTSGNNQRNAISFGLGLRAKIGRIFAELKSDFNWLITNASNRRDDHIRLDLTRYF